MNITIVGAGAMGSLFGALLSESGHAVCLLDIWQAHVAAVNANGLSVERDGRTRLIPIRAETDFHQAGEADLAIVFVKSTQTEHAAQTAKAVLKKDGWALTLQNGMGNAEAIARVVTASRILAGTTSHGATMLGPGKIRHAGTGPTIIGAWTGEDPTGAATVAECFRQAGIETTVAEDVRSVIWNKLLVNVGINAITALTGIRNGQLLDLDATRWISRAAVEEAMTVARSLGVQVRDDAVAHVFKIAEATAGNRSSMGQDVDHHRGTEIGAINGYVVRQAETIGVPAPVNRTLSGLVETLQAHYSK
jgi:2-dehydropantoate 2-reductase